MFYYLEGLVAHTEPGIAVIDINGVGFICNTSLATLAKLEAGTHAKLYTHVHVREDAMDIYGFTTQEELSCYKMLVSISGVGPKAALSILSSGTPEQLALAVITGDEKMLTAAPGIGKKTAQRIILELKDKMKKEQLEMASAAGSSGPVNFGSRANEAATALGVLGYSQAEAAEAMRGINTEQLPVEEIVRMALKKMMRG